jgi:hypothetical protein
MGSIVQKFIASEIDRALTRHTISPSSGVRAEIEARVEMCGAGIRVCDGNRILPLDDFISQLRHNARFAADFPAPLPRVSRRDIAKLRDNFDQICDGTVVVE